MQGIYCGSEFKSRSCWLRILEFREAHDRPKGLHIYFIYVFIHSFIYLYIHSLRHMHYTQRPVLIHRGPKNFYVKTFFNQLFAWRVQNPQW